MNVDYFSLRELKSILTAPYYNMEEGNEECGPLFLFSYIKCHHFVIFS